MSEEIRDMREVTIDQQNNVIFEKNVSVPIPGTELPVRVNVYRTNETRVKRPVLVTYGPYGKDIWYGKFNPKSYAEVDPQHQSKYAAWETPEPVFWVKHGYAVVRADERGFGQSPGVMDPMSSGTSEAFVHLVEWAASQKWSSGKVGLLGVSYYAGTQWRVAARRPKGLAAIVPWEGMADYYRDRCRHGGILSNGFIKFWWNRQVVTNQYGRPGRAVAGWGDNTLERDLSPEELQANRQDQNLDNAANRYMDEAYYSSKDYNLEDIEVPVLSVANWGGITLHLRGNVEGFIWAGSKNKWLRFITGRHDLPFYYPSEVKVQRSFLDAFLKDDDWGGWKAGKVPRVTLTLRKGNKGVNDAVAEREWEARDENEWPIARTVYTKYFLTTDDMLSEIPPKVSEVTSYKSLGTASNPQLLQFRTAPFQDEIEITGHITARLSLSMTPGLSNDSKDNSFDIDVFLTLRHHGFDGNEIFYTGAAGDPVPLTKGWLRLSLRAIDQGHLKHRHYLPRRNYLSTDVLPVEADRVYATDIEVWPTNVVVEPGGYLVFEIASGDTQGSGKFEHNEPTDRPSDIFGGMNHIHLGPDGENYVVLPVIPARQ